MNNGETKGHTMATDTRKQLVRASGGAFMLNQHAPKFADKRTKRNRSRADQRRNALADNG